MDRGDIVILGSGMAGLGAAHKFHSNGYRTKMFDKHDFAGGHTATFTYDDGFVFDDGPHISFTADPRIQKLFADNVDGKFEVVHAHVNNYYQGIWVKHPVQANLERLPTDLKVNCILDFIEASKVDVDGKPENYMEWLEKTFGHSIAHNFPAVYGKKYHTVGAELMSTVWIGPRLYRPSMEEVIRGAVETETPEIHYVTEFRYPTEGGFFEYLRPFYEQTELSLGHEVVEIDPAEQKVTFANGTVQDYRELVSSIPLPILIPMIKGAPQEVLDAAASLACTQCVTVNIGLARTDITPATWSYVYDEDLLPVRLNFPHNMSPKTCPEGCGSIQAEAYFSDKYKPLTVEPEELIEPMIQDLIKMGLIREDEPILHKDARLIPFANVIFDLDRETALPIVHAFLDEVGIFYAGRFGEWGYHWTDEAFKSGERAAKRVMNELAIQEPRKHAG